MPTVEISGAGLYYNVKGEGEPLVLIPGFASGAWSWSWQVDELSRSFRIVTFDPRGIGQSEMGENHAGAIERIADDVAVLLDELKIKSAHVLGISFGGFVTQDFALRYPARVRRLILASTSFGGPGHVPPSIEVLTAFASTEGLNSSERIRRYLTVAFSPGFVATNGDDVERFCRLREANEVSREAYSQQLHSAMNFDVESRLEEITAETLVISGDSDTVVPTENSRNLAAAIPGSRLEIIEGAGHMAFVEKAGEFNRIVSEFLARR
jgi:pimeloyl-ACP methyl ester carboxylesterase